MTITQEKQHAIVLIETSIKFVESMHINGIGRDCALSSLDETAETIENNN